ncbi:hypothetical protein TSUD_182630 [Trifolium subterraneum]|uniref:Reverse transcriptase zinc-binding domain-containing protein n=1 Tax=Trifolium subterraneum TaxID=3900 RepID=A0A2Z6LGL6_TRISU|nr:hypothetical protein TSUD_182630 [Trifolium subterraneum]
MEQKLHFHGRAYSNPGFHSFKAVQDRATNHDWDQSQKGRHQTRYNLRRDAVLRRPRSQNRCDAFVDDRCVASIDVVTATCAFSELQEVQICDARDCNNGRRYQQQQITSDKVGLKRWISNKGNDGRLQSSLTAAGAVGMDNDRDQQEKVGTVKLGTELKRRNKRGEPFGFVKFSNVRDVTKMTTALNNVWFGHFRVRARVDSFDRNNTTAGRRLATGSSLAKGDVERKGIVKRKAKQGEDAGIGTDKGGPPNDLRAGEIVVNLGQYKERLEKTKGQVIVGGSHPKGPSEPEVIGNKDERHTLLRKYKSKPDDVSWAQNGMVVTISNGEAVLVVQTRISDAGFTNVFLIPMAADKVFVRSSGGDDVLAALNNAKEFFTLFFSHWKRWDFNAQPTSGEPGFLRADSCSADKDILDFARVLIATSDLSIINTVVTVLVDGTRVEVKVVEEWGYALGEDTCLFEDESDEEASQADNEARHWDPEAERVVDTMVDKLADGLEVEDDTRSQANKKDNVQEDLGIPIPDGEAGEICSDFVLKHPVGSDILALGISGSPLVLGDQRSMLICSPTVGLRSPVGEKGTEMPLAGARAGAGLKKGGQNAVKRRKAGGKMERRCKVVPGSNYMSRPVSSDEAASSTSVNNDWKHWVVMQGNAQVAEDDVREVGKVGVMFHGDNENMFSVLARAGKGKKTTSGASGGLLTLWDSSEVDVWASESHESVLWCHGRFIKSGEEFSVANVYAPCDPGAKQQLWDTLSVRIQALGRSRVCVCGDFNAVRSIEERRSGRGDDLSMSRLDKFLLSGEWCLTWPNCTQVAWMKGLSDHCPLILAANEEEWGPRPSRMLNCWKDVPDYNIFVKDKWNSFQVDGWGGFVLKERFKMIKSALKDWHKTHTQNLPSRIESLQDRAAVLDVKGGEDDLSNEEISELHGITSDIHSLSRLNASICWQQSRSRWLKEGDANSKYFHSVLANRRRGNAISSLEVGGFTVEGVAPIRQAVVSHFASHFKAVNVVRPGLILLPSNVCTRLRPISLVDSLYKILAKVLANWLRLVMGKVILESQTAFIRDRQILDGILIANEVVDEARRAKKELMLFKVDFEKAYDFLDLGLLGCCYGAPISVSHLQFADDTVQALRVVLVLFETMSDLNVNFNKSMQLRRFNLALLGKWCWRLLVDREGLWFCVLAARYGVERGRLCVRGMSGSAWWRGVARIRDGGGEVEGGWLGGNISRQMGNGSYTFFWTDLWVDGTPLSERFGRLFDLAANKSVSIADMFQSWLTLQTDEYGSWIWIAVILFVVPLKVSILAWRLLRDRLPTKANLTSRGILPVGDSHCVSGCGSVESAHHVFISCSMFGSLWSIVSSWVGSATVTPQTLSDHFVQFTTSAGGTRVRRSFMQLIWLAYVWVVWTERNHRLFRGSTNSSLHMLDKIKTFSFRWLTAKSCIGGLVLCFVWALFSILFSILGLYGDLLVTLL